MPDDLKDKIKAILNIKNKKWNCVRLSLTAALYPVDMNGFIESKNESNLVDD